MSYHPSHCTCAHCTYPAVTRRLKPGEAALLCAALFAGLIFTFVI